MHTSKLIGRAALAAVLLAATALPTLAGETTGAAGGSDGDPQDPARTLVTVERELAAAPADPALQARRLDLLIEVGRRAEAMKEARARYDADGDDAVACFLYARFLSPRSAIRLYEKAVRLDPKLAPAWAALAEQHDAAGDADRAVEAMATCVKLAPTADHQDRHGWMLERAGRFASAREAYRSALRADAGHLRARENLALLLAGREAAADREAALTEASELIDRAPRRAASWITMALVRGRRGEHKAAAAAYEKALAVAPTDRTALFGLARAYRKVERFDLAAQALGRAERAHPDDAQVAVQRGLLELDRGDLPAAEEAFHAATRRDSRDPRPQYLLAVALDRLQRPDDALKRYRKAASLGRDDGRYQLALAFAHERRTEYRHALRAYEKAAELLPDDPRPVLGRGAVLQKQGKAKEAVAEYESVVEERPDDWALHLLLGVLHAEALGDLDSAMPYFERYLALNGEPEAVRRWLPDAGKEKDGGKDGGEDGDDDGM